MKISKRILLLPLLYICVPFIAAWTAQSHAVRSAANASLSDAGSNSLTPWSHYAFPDKPSKWAAHEITHLFNTNPTPTPEPEQPDCDGCMVTVQVHVSVQGGNIGMIPAPEFPPTIPPEIEIQIRSQYREVTLIPITWVVVDSRGVREGWSITTQLGNQDAGTETSGPYSPLAIHLPAKQISMDPASQTPSYIAPMPAQLGHIPQVILRARKEQGMGICWINPILMVDQRMLSGDKHTLHETLLITLLIGP